MNWKAQLKKYEFNKDWKSAIDLMQKTIIANPGLDAYLSMNYLLMNFLVEEDYDSREHDFYTELLKTYFLESYSKFLHNPEYLFYTGVTAHMSEWYFGIDIEKAKAMIREASQSEPENILYKWGCCAYMDTSSAKDKKRGVPYAEKILAGNGDALKSKGALGEYLRGIIEHWIMDCKRI